MIDFVTICIICNLCFVKSDHETNIPFENFNDLSFFSI